jgi:hypothetical protein
MNTEIFIEGNRVDLTADISALITFALDDVKDFASRSTAFSKTVVLPGTGRNNDIFGNIFDTARANDFDAATVNIGYNFNAAHSARCLIFQDNLQTFKGTARLLEIVRDKGVIEYEVALHGELTSLNVALSNGYLEDLDFSAYDTVFNATNIVASWNNQGTGVYFPLIDYGTYSALKHDWDIRTFRPSLFVREYIDKMMTAANFRYNCPLFDTDRFKSLIVPHNRKKLINLNAKTLDVFAASSRYDYTDGPSKLMPFPSLAIMQDFTANVGDTEFTRITTAFSGTATFRLAGTWEKSTTIPFVFSIKVNGVAVHTMTWESSSTSSAQSVDRTDTFSLSMAVGDILSFEAAEVQFGSGATGYLQLTTGVCRFSLAGASLTEVEITPDSAIVINDCIPKNIRQVDFLSSIVKLFNLYVYESRFDEKLINIAPYVDYYSDSPKHCVDWSYKLNRNAPVRIRPMSELNSKVYNFKYKDDNDYYNELYKKRYNQSYGCYIYDSQFEFATQTTNLELIFAPTPIVGYAGEDKFYSTIFKRTGPDSAPVEENVDSVIRILQTKKLTCLTWDIKNAATVLSSQTTYGYAGHLDDPTSVSNDLNFGALQEVFFTFQGGDLSQTQFNVFWDTYMAEITDKDSHLLIGRFYLTAKDIFDLDFSRYIFLDGVLYRLNKIKDYNASIPSDTETELIKVINVDYLQPPVIAEPAVGPYLLYDGPPLDYTHDQVDYDQAKILYE